jgi:hypothetical protein
MKNTVLQPSEAEIQMMVMIKLWWTAMHFTPSAIPSLSRTKNEVIQYFRQIKKLPLMQMG